MTENEPNIENNSCLTLEEFNNKKEDIFTFITPLELESVVCNSIYDEIILKYKNDGYKLELNHNSSLYVYDDKYILCHIFVNIDNKYNIKLHINSNTYDIKNITDAREIVKNLGNYFTKLKELYKYVKQNYYLLYPNKLNMIAIYDDLKCPQECCNCECFREKIYVFDCSEQNYFLFSKNRELIKSFKSIEEIDSYQELQCYKYKCKAYYCCC
jgi:hypothetical protein